MPSLKKKSTRQNKSIKILNIINTKIDMVQETLNKMVNKEEDIDSGEFTTTTVTTPTSETIGSYQSDMNSGEEEAGMAGEEAVPADQGSISSLTDNASYGAPDNASNEASGKSDFTSDEMISSDDALSTAANKGSETATRSPVTPLPYSPHTPSGTPPSEEYSSGFKAYLTNSPEQTENGGVASPIISNETTVATSDSGSPEQYAQNPNATPESWEVRELDEKLKEHEEIMKERKNKTGGKKRTQKRNQRRNMKSRRRQSRR
jgi:hypothetical protein